MPNLQELSEGARAATQQEQQLTFLAGCRLYPKAIGWSILLSSAIILDGFCGTLIYSSYTVPSFTRRFGMVVNPNAPADQQSYQIPVEWQTALPNAAGVGGIIGLLTNGIITDRFGYRKTMFAALIFLCLANFLSFFAVSLEMLLLGEIFCGIPWGVFQTLPTTYASEVMPVALRGYLLSNINMCWLVGQLCGVLFSRLFVNINSQWSYRIPFGIQWAVALPILIGVYFAPESPWWLIRHGRQTEAKQALSRLISPRPNYGLNIDDSIAMMRHTNEVEKQLGGDGMSYFDCFRGTDLRRTEIACMAWVAQQLSGSNLSTYAAYFYEQVGLPVDDAFDLNLGMYGLAIVAGIIAWFLIPSIGRRTLYIWGLLLSFLILIVGGIFGVFTHLVDDPWILGSLIILLTFVYDLTIGPVCYIVVAEIPSTRLRVKTVTLARVSYNLVSFITSTITPRMLNPTAWNWKGKACFLYAGTTLPILLWCYWRLPETLKMSYLEIDILFEKKAKTSKFREFRNVLQSGINFDSSLERQPGVWRGY